MRVAIVHYHLDPGGVTRVIEAASLALTAAGVRHVILAGGCGVSPHAVLGASCLEALPVRHLEGLGYLTTQGHLTAEKLTYTLRAAAAEALGGPPDLWHFHNHSLGKNRLLPEVVSRLAQAGERLVLQIHDLAEQGRPANYPLIADRPDLYPFSPRIRYAFLNSRDLDVFTSTGLPAENAILLPNPVVVPDGIRNATGPAIVFAPVRGIRRKNLGELLLLSALAPAGTRFAISLAPRNPEALPVHDTWRKFAGSLGLPIAFDVVGRYAPAAGAATTFESWIEHCTHYASASVAEGFGLTLLEAAAVGKPLIGRNLPHLAADLARHGIRAGHLYDQLRVPVDWIDLPILRDFLAADLARNHRFYQRPLPPSALESTLAGLVQDDLLDFGNLPEPLQQGVIERLADPANHSVPRVLIDGEERPASEWLAAVIANREPTATPGQLAPYSLETYQKSLVALYSDLVRQAVVPLRRVSPAAILTAHLAPESFHFLLSALKPGLAAPAYRAVIFDIYGTLLHAAAGGVRPDPAADPSLRQVLENFGHRPPESPSTALHAAVLRHHAAAGTAFPEIDLRVLWREVLALDPDTNTAPLVAALEAVWHPASPIPGADAVVRSLAASGMSLGLLSNAQSNTLASLGGIADLFAPELTLLSYQLGIAKPSPALFEILTDRLAGRGIAPAETLFVGNDPLHDIAPAAAAGFRTALFTGHPDSLRPGVSSPDFTFGSWRDLMRHLQS